MRNRYIIYAFTFITINILFHSEYAPFIYHRFLSKYDINDLLYQEKDEILSRLFYVQEREECYFYGIPVQFIFSKNIYFYKRLTRLIALLDL